MENALPQELDANRSDLVDILLHDRGSAEYVPVFEEEKRVGYRGLINHRQGASVMYSTACSLESHTG